MSTNENQTTEVDPGNARSRLLAEAEKCVNGDRNAQYGDPNDDFRRTAAMWNQYLAGVMSRKLDGEWAGTFSSMTIGPGTLRDANEACLDAVIELIEPHDVGWMMILLKASRSTVSPSKMDHPIDAAGYAACIGDCIESGQS